MVAIGAGLPIKLMGCVYVPTYPVLAGSKVSALATAVTLVDREEL